MAVKEDLRRELGFWTALTIGAGTMIGAGIFLLSGTALRMVGPAAIFSYLAAAVVCIITAASAAELATGMPTSGGDYFFVSRSLGPAFGAISGIGIWLSLTFAIAFYLFGLGEYLHEFLPISPLWAAAGAGLLLIGLNVYGAKESGGTQLTVVLILLIILVVFTLAGLFGMTADNLSPFFPDGPGPVFRTTAVVFISFLGFVKIAAVSEEIIDPSRNLPRALVGSVALVSVLYVLIIFVLAGFFSPEEITEIRAPLTVAAERLFGRVGQAVLIFAGLLATLSSANASIMAASRINLAMSRDRMIPGWLSAIHPRRLTPFRAVLLTGLLSLIFLFLKDLETLAEIASVLQLYSYAALNIGCVILRTADPDWYRPSFRVPLTPWVQFFAATGCLTIILFSGFLAQAIILSLIALSLTWYFFWGKHRVNITYGLPRFRQRWAVGSWRALLGPAPRYAPVEAAGVAPVVRVIEASRPRQVLVALANPQHQADLLRLGRYLATGARGGGAVTGLHLVQVPLQTPLEAARPGFAERSSIERTMAELASQAAVARNQHVDDLVQRPLVETTFTAESDVAHDVFGSLLAETTQHRADLLLMGWQGPFNVSQIYNSPVQRVLSNATVDVGVLKNRGLESIGSILVPWGGGPHAQLGLEFAVRIAEAEEATIHLLRVIDPSADADREERALTRAIDPIVDGYERLHLHIQKGDFFTDRMLAFLDEAEAGDASLRPFDLIIIGASHEWRIRNVLFGSIPDLVADYARCSVLMVRRYLFR